MELDRILIHTGDIPQQPGTARFVCISDTHDKAFSLKIPQGDVLLHTGDFTRRGSSRQIQTFVNFMQKMPHQYKIAIAGNHDMSLDKQNLDRLIPMFGLPPNTDSDALKSLFTSFIYLQDSGVEVLGYKIWGSPWTPTFFDWGFNLDRGAPIDQKWTLIPEDTDILLTHGPPAGFQDRTYASEAVGCVDLLRKVQQIKPIVHVFGHIHQGYGFDYDRNTAYINASSCTLQYRPTNPPLVFDLPLR